VYTGVLFIEKKAFDSTNIEGMWYKMRKKGASEEKCGTY